MAHGLHPFLIHVGVVSDVLQSASFSSKCVCEGGCAGVKPSGNGSGESGGLSTGSILLIVYVLSSIWVILILTYM